jgi:hypothetical protein
MAMRHHNIVRKEPSRDNRALDQQLPLGIQDFLKSAEKWDTGPVRPVWPYERIAAEVPVFIGPKRNLLSSL